VSSEESDIEKLAQYEPFVATVRCFVSLVETEPGDKSPMRFLLDLNDAMLDVAKCGLYLDYAYLDTESEIDSDKHEVPLEVERETRIRLDSFLKLAIDAAKSHAERDESTHLAVHLFTNDVAEAYRDLLHGLRLWDDGSVEARGEACWHWRFHKWHWHEHLYRALFGNCLMRFVDMDSGMDDDSQNCALKAIPS